MIQPSAAVRRHRPSHAPTMMMARMLRATPCRSTARKQTNILGTHQCWKNGNVTSMRLRGVAADSPAATELVYVFLPLFVVVGVLATCVGDRVGRAVVN